MLRSGRGGGLALLLLATYLAAASRERVSLEIGSRSGVSTSDGDAPVESALLLPSVSEFDFGTLPKGGRKSAGFRLRNPGNTVVQVNRIEASCECLRIELDKKTIAGGEEIQAMVVVDFSDDPGFGGALLLEAIARAAEDSNSAFAVRARVRVE